MSEKKRNFREGWWIRKAIYVAVAVAGVDRKSTRLNSSHD